MDSAEWPQNFPEVGLLVNQQPMEEVVSNNTCNDSTHRQMFERKARPQEQLNCPRCNSTNTKFCYYNNYSLTQPRYFCKSCRRYWTEGGSLRNVPVGGASRKNKRSTSSAAAASSNSNNKLPADPNPPSLSHFSSLQNPKIFEGQELNLAFQGMHNETHDISQYGIGSRGLDSLIPTTQMQDSNTLYFSSGFPLQDIKPGTLSFSIDHGIGNNNNNVHHGHGVQENGNGRLFFPFGELKQLSSPTNEADQNKGQGTSIGYWNGMLSGGSR